MRLLDRFENYVIIILLSAMSILVFVTTMARYVFFYPIPWGGGRQVHDGVAGLYRRLGRIEEGLSPRR